MIYPAGCGSSDIPTRFCTITYLQLFVDYYRPKLPIILRIPFGKGSESVAQ